MLTRCKNSALSMQLSHTPPIGLCSNDIILRMADRGICDVTSARVRMTVSRDTSRSISGRLATPLVATLSDCRGWH